MTLSLQIFWNQSYIDLCSQTTTIQSHSLNNQLHSTYHLGILWIPFLEMWRDWFILTFPLSCMTQGVQLHRTHVSTFLFFFFAKPSCWQIACKVWHTSSGSEEFSICCNSCNCSHSGWKLQLSCQRKRQWAQMAEEGVVTLLFIDECPSVAKTDLQHFLWIWLLQPSTRLTSSLQLSCASRMAGAGKPELRHLSPRSMKNSVAPRRKRSRRMVCLRRVWRKPWTCWEWTRQSSRLRAQCLWVCLTDGPH